MSTRPSQLPERTARVRVAALALIGSAALALPLLGTAAPNAAIAPTAGPAWSGDATELALPDSSRALVASDGAAILLGTDGSITMRTVRGELAYGSSTSGVAQMSKDELIAELMRPTLRPYAPSEVVVTFADGVEVPQESPAVTGDARTDEVLASIGMERIERLFTAADDASWRASRDSAEQATGAAVLDLRRTYRLSLSGAEPREAAAALLALPTVSWASPAWTVTAPQVTGVSMPLDVTSAAARVAAEVASSVANSSAKLPTNYGLGSNAQSHWNAPGLNAATAYHHVTQELGELPGQGEIITTVGVGPLTSDPNGPCGGDVQFFGPTTTVIGDQRYIDMPSMPLIPTFTATPAGDLDPLGEVCTNRDPLLADIGLALSVMSPLPHHRQRPEAIGSGLTDLLGLAPGAQHRLVVPGSGLPTTIDLAGALLGASQQSPRPSVITASAHIGGEDVGFPNRYLEDDALLRSVITTIVQSDISVAVAAGAARRPTATRRSGRPAAVTASRWRRPVRSRPGWTTWRCPQHRR